MSLDGAIIRLQTIVKSCSDVTIRAAPNHPVDDAGMLPLSIAYIAQGTGQADNATMTRLLLTLRMDVHFERSMINLTYQQINKLIPEFVRRVAADPTLAGEVDTVNFPITFFVQPAQWDQVTTQMVGFEIPIKIITTPKT